MVTAAITSCQKRTGLVCGLSTRKILTPWSIQTWGFDHRKLMTVDGTVGFVGGYNIGSLYATGWRDTHCRVVGADVAELENAFIDFWNLHTGRRRRRIEHNPKRTWQTRMWVHRNVPRLQVYPIRNMYLEAIDRAQERIWLTHAYLIPDDDLTYALTDAADRGVDVRIIVPAESNHIVADWLSRGFYATFLRRGVLTEREMLARQEILFESYIRHVNVEVRLALSLGRTSILPAAMAWLKEAGIVNHTGPGSAYYSKLQGHLSGLIEGLDALEEKFGQSAGVEDTHKRAAFLRDEVLPALAVCRGHADALEEIVDDGIWPLPKYTELLWEH